MVANEKLNLTMLCDFYELTMGNGYFVNNMQDTMCYFDVFYSSVPDEGGYAICAGLEQIIDYIKPEGTISILGVSENHVPINTRMVLEKGLLVFGSSRSGYDDFKNTVDMFAKHPEIVEHLKNIVGDVIDVRNIDDMHTAFQKDIAKAGGKTIMLWNV